MAEERVIGKRGGKGYSEEQKKTLVAEIERLREDEGLSQAVACHKAGISVGTFIQWRSGRSWKTLASGKKKRKYVRRLDLNSCAVLTPSSPAPQPPVTNDEIMVFMVKGNAAAIGSVIGNALNKFYGEVR